MRTKRGFTLLEVLLAMALMTTALILLANSWSAGFNRVKKIQVTFELASLLERKMDEYDRRFRGKLSPQMRYADRVDL